MCICVCEKMTRGEKDNVRPLLPRAPWGNVVPAGDLVGNMGYGGGGLGGGFPLSLLSIPNWLVVFFVNLVNLDE